MRIDIVSIFPEMFPPVLGQSILKRAQEAGKLQLALHDLRAFTHDRHHSVDDRPYGGGPGMLMKPEPIFEAVEFIRRNCPPEHSEKPGSCQIVLVCPRGETLSTPLAKTLADVEHLIFICGHYEGVDERVRASLADRTVSIGDYVLTGGELAAMVIIDSLARFIPGVIGHSQATQEESFAAGLLEYPQYTRPPVFRGMAVPDVLLGGDHEQIAHWRKMQAVAHTMAVRPDLMEYNHTQQRGSSCTGSH